MAADHGDQDAFHGLEHKEVLRRGHAHSIPGEMVNLVHEPRCAPQLEQGRRSLRKWYRENGEPLDQCYVV